MLQKSLLLRRAFPALRKAIEWFAGSGDQSTRLKLSRATRAGVVSSAMFLLAVSLWMVWVSSSLITVSLGLVIFASLVLFFSFTRKLTVQQANLLSLLGHLCALVSFYYSYTRLVNVSYVTDSIAGTYLGIVKVLQLQNPYTFSIKTVLDQLGFPPSLYTPRVDGSFEFHLNYPAMNFLAMIPAYLAGLHDVRDGVFLFHIASILTIFALVPARLKAISLAPFALGFPFVIGYSWTDSVWAFFILLTAVLWKRDKGLSMVTFGLAVATKQIAIVAAPFLLIRLWNESEGSKVRAFLKCVALACASFLAPNIPFILASPSSWWDAIAAPYLPGRTSMVPGGIGLSEILPDLGVAVSPVVFTLITTMVSAVCVGLYLLRYKRLNRFLWAFPIIILFFYSRSLPNYILFWSLPYLFEWLKYGSPSLAVFGRHLFAVGVMKNSAREMIGRLNRRVGPIALLAVVLSTVVIGSAGAYAVQVSKPRLDVKVIGMGDPDSLGVATSLSVTVSNYGSESMSPRFFVKWFFLWDLWSANSTSVLLPSSAQSYELTATDALAAVPRGSSFRVAVYDSASGEVQGLSKSYVSLIGRPDITNPGFRWWTLDYGTGRLAPYGWRPSLANVDRSEGIGMADTQGSSGVELILNSTRRQSLGEVSLLQQLYFNETSLNARVYASPSAYAPNNFAFGLRATDHVKSLYFVLSPTASARSVSTSGSNTTVVLPFSYSSWQSVSFDIENSWLSQGWSAPARLDVSFFLRSSAAGQVSVEIQDLTL